MELDSSIREYLPKLYFIKAISSTRIAKSLSISTSEVKRIFSKLYSLGLYLKPDVCISKMGLKPAIVLVNKKAYTIKRDIALNTPYLKSVWIAPAYGVVFVLFLPVNSKIIIDGSLAGNEDAKIFYYLYKLRSRPSPKLLEMLSDSLKKVARSPPFETIPPVEKWIREKAKFDSLDLKILKAASSTPWVSMKDLISLLKLRRSQRLEFHVQHAEELISGYGFTRIGILYSDYGSMKFLFYKCKDSSPFARTVLTHPFVLVVAWSRNDVFIQTYYPAKYGVLFHLTLSEIAPSYECEEIVNFEITSDPAISLITSFPDASAEYSKLLRFWRSTSVKLSQLLSCIEWNR